MTYFPNAKLIKSITHEHAWRDAVSQLRNASIYKGNKHMQQVSHPLEAKALHIFTFASRFMNAVDELVSRHDGNWHYLFVETSIIMYPIIEMIGMAVMDKNNTSRMKVSGDRLAAGIYWLQEPSKLSTHLTGGSIKEDKTPMTRVKQYMPAHRTVPTMGNIYALRHYYLHGLGRSNLQEENIIDYALPKGVIGAASANLYIYWNNLINDGGATNSWLDRLAIADIHPFKISGSNGAEAGLIDPDILDRIYKQNLRSNPQ